VVDDGQQGPGYTAVTLPVFSSDSAHIAYAATTDQGTSVIVVDGRSIPKPAVILTNPLVFSPDGKRIAYGIGTPQNPRLIVEDLLDQAPSNTASVEFSGLFPPVFSPDGTHIAYHTLKDQRNLVVVDGKPGPEYHSIGNFLRGEFLSFSLDGNHVAYAASDGDGSFAVIDGQRGPKYDQISTLALSPNGQHVGFVVGSEEPDKILNSNGNTYFVMNRRSFVVLDGTSSPKYDEVLSLRFMGDGALEFLAVRRGTLYRVRNSTVRSSRPAMDSRP
jgi:WD40 repeat protein